ncbi:MAG: heat-shock protein Hsp20 [Phototrophicales bacterium]|nr:MAG: heat-shock protein Hsp20 [Phototrophicales bacterium]
MTNLVRWNPTREIMEIQNTFDRLFNSFWPTTTNLWNTAYNNNMLAIDLHETDDAYEMVINVPGIDPENIDVSITENVLSIVAELQQEKREENAQTLLQERVYGKFSRQITLPAGVDADHVETHYENGVLRLTLPKQESSKRRRIPIRIPKLLNN